MKISLAIGPLVLGLLFMAAPGGVQAPSPQELRKMYGELTMERFAVRAGVTLTAEYGSDRLACQLLIEPARLLEEVKNKGPVMSSQEVSEVLQEVVPVSTRGKEIDATVIQVEGDKILRTDYEKVSIRRICSVQACSPSSENQDLATVVVFKRGACPRHIE